MHSVFRLVLLATTIEGGLAWAPASVCARAAPSRAAVLMQDAGVRQEEPTVTVAPTAGKGKRPKLTLHQRINRQIVKADDSDAVLHLVEKHAESLNAINIATALHRIAARNKRKRARRDSLDWVERERQMSHAVNAELRRLFYAPIAPPTEPLAITVDAAASQLPAEHAEPLLHALRLQPSHAAHYHQLALLAQQYNAPHETRAALLERASALSPSDAGLKFEVSNARKDHFYELHTGSTDSGGAAALKHARKRWLASLRQVAALEEGRWSSTVNQNLGTALQLMGKFRESEEHFERALHLLGLSLKTRQARRELSEPERRDAKDTLAALDLSLAHRGKPRETLTLTLTLTLALVRWASTCL